ncbi:MAG TPA: hypothetical protein VML96_10600 [Egibacteraceae bacterium]|nr:hypothetical protein [Egibacteraceae bacterium]
MPPWTSGLVGFGLGAVSALLAVAIFGVPARWALLLFLAPLPLDVLLEERRRRRNPPNRLPHGREPPL